MQIQVLIKRMEVERDREKRSTFDQAQECITIEHWQKVRTDNVIPVIRGTACKRIPSEDDEKGDWLLAESQVVWARIELR